MLSVYAVRRCQNEGVDLSWAVLYTKPRQEARATENLKGLGLDVTSPLSPMETTRRGVISVDFEPLFPAFRDISAIFEESDGDKRVILLFDLLGKSARLSVPVSAVKRE